MNSIQFPKMFNRTVTNLVYDKDAIQQNLETVIGGCAGELFCDPYFGSNIKKLMFSQNDFIFKDLLIDEVYSTIKTFMPQIIVKRSDINVEKGDLGQLYITIAVTYKANFKTDMYNIVVLGG